MRLLIVDDEESAILAVRQGVDWDRLNFSAIYTAADKREAIQIVEKHDVDILLCDIEMPQGSGLELLEWINIHKPGICCIFMTCHADFTYAQQAVHLGSFEYVLKPLDFENLEKILNEASIKVGQERQLKTASAYWDQGKKAVERQFWRKLFIGDIVSDDENIREYISRNHLDIPVNGSFLPVFISPKRFPSGMSDDDIKLFGFALRNMAEELFVIEGAAHEVEDFQDKILVMLTLKGEGEKVVRSRLEAVCETYINAADEYLHIQVCCYIGEVSFISEIPNVIEVFHKMDFNNIVLYHDVVDFRPRTVLPGSAEHIQMDFSGLLTMIIHGNFKGIIREITKALEKQNDLSGNASFFRYFFHGIYVLLEEFSRRNNAPLGDLVDYEKNLQLSEAAEKSMQGLILWLTYIMDALGELKKNNETQSDPVDRVSIYVHQHIEDALSVEEIAASVHLNPDYLNRIFKKERGMSLNKYVILQKMDRAKWLLRHTNWKIGDVAAAVGYYNYSSFNRAFAKVAGQSPQAWRHMDNKA